MTSALPWRLVSGRHSYADFSASVSPAVERAVARGLAPSTLFVNVFDSDSITIGANEDPYQVLDLDFCRAHAITVRRRPNGGGAIYAGKGSAFLVFYLRADQPRIPQSAAEAFPALLGATAETLNRLWGLAARYRPLNDVEIDGRKLMPTSIKLEDGVLTLRILLNVTAIDTAIAARALPMPPEKVKDKVHKDIGSRYTWLERELGRVVSEGDLEILARAITAQAFDPPGLDKGHLGPEEHALAEGFRHTMESDSWLFENSFANRLARQTRPGDRLGLGRAKAVGGMIWTSLLVRDGAIAGAIVNGDWHPRPLASVAWLEQALVGSPAEAEALRARIDAFLARADVEFAGIDTGDLMESCARALSSLAPTQ